MIEQAIADLESGDETVPEMTEDGAKEVLMTLIKQKVSRPTQMSYRQVQQQKREIRNSRGFKPVGSQSNSSIGTMRRDIQALKAVTKRKSCGGKGHWHKECPSKGVANRPPAASASTGTGTASHSWWSLVDAVPGASTDSHVSRE